MYSKENNYLGVEADLYNIHNLYNLYNISSKSGIQFCPKFPFGTEHWAQVQAQAQALQVGT